MHAHQQVIFNSLKFCCIPEEEEVFNSMCGFTDVTIQNQTQISVVLQLQSRQHARFTKTQKKLVSRK